MGISIDLSSQMGRNQLVEQIAHTENVRRKAESLRQTEIYGDYLFNHVWDNIAGRFSVATAREVPIVAHINLARRIVKAEASIYKSEPERMFSETSEDQTQVLEKIYRDMMANTKFMRSNESFKLQQQNHVMIIPKDGKFMMRILKNHHIDSIDDTDNPEEAAGYVIHGFDRTFFNENRRRSNNQNQFGKFNQFTNQREDGYNQVIGDNDDWKSTNMRYLVSTKEANFIMNGKGEILSDTDESPIPGILPIVDISQEKDFTYWVKQGDAIVDATIDYNVTMSDIGHIVQNQGFAQAYLIGDDSIVPDNIQIGPNQIIKLPSRPGDDRPEFGYAQPGSDINGALEYANDKLMAFLTSRGLDPDVVSTDSTGGTSSSGVQEFLRMMKHFKATKEDYDTYKRAEMQIYEIVKAYQNMAPQLILPKYQTGVLPEDSELFIQFTGPEMLQTEQEKVDVILSKIDAGLMSRVDALMELEGLDKEAAQERIEEIDADEMTMGGQNADIGTEFSSYEASEPELRGLEQRGEDESEE